METSTIQIFQSGIWQLNSTVISSQGNSLIIDAGYFPKELEEIKKYVTSQGKINFLAFTHGHWDHIQGRDVFPEVPVLVSPALYEAIKQNTEEAKSNQQQVEEFDSRWYIKRNAPFHWPTQIRAIADEEIFFVGDIQIQALLLPGHSNDGLGFFLPEQKVLLIGDYLSPCEIPFVHQLTDYQNTLQRLLSLLPLVEQIIPGHGPCLSAQTAKEIAQADLAYLEKLFDYLQKGENEKALSLPFPRATHVPGMREAHLENYKRVQSILSLSYCVKFA